MLAVGFFARPLSLGHQGASGENGRDGAGGATIDVSIEGPRVQAPQAATAHAPTVSPLSRSAAAPRLTTRSTQPAEVSSEHSDGPAQAVAAQPVSAQASSAATAGAVVSAASGTDATTTDSGRAREAARVRRLILGSAGLIPGSVDAQRALLPPPITCDDPVAGVWRAHRYDPRAEDWALFTLTITRESEDRITGTIVSHMWSGSAGDYSPPVCMPGGMDYTVRMNASGTVNGQRITFGAQTYRVVRASCPIPFFGYNADHFTGTIDETIQEFQSVNNDGGRDINAPYVFRRISCGPPPAGMGPLASPDDAR